MSFSTLDAQALQAALGPAPFRFSPSPNPLRSPAFGRSFKTLAMLLIACSALWLWHLWQKDLLGGRPALYTFGAGLALMAYTTWHIFTSHTELSSSGLHQSWMWRKALPMGELAYAKLIRVRGLQALIAPRLYVRTLGGKFMVFYAADAHMLDNFERLCKELAAFRRMD